MSAEKRRPTAREMYRRDTREMIRHKGSVPIGRIASDAGETEYRIAPSPGAARYLPEGWVVERRTLAPGLAWTGNHPTPWGMCETFVYPDVEAAAVALYRTLSVDPTFKTSPFAPWPFNREPEPEQPTFGGVFVCPRRHIRHACTERTIPQAPGQLALFEGA